MRPSPEQLAAIEAELANLPRRPGRPELAPLPGDEDLPCPLDRYREGDDRWMRPTRPERRK